MVTLAANIDADDAFITLNTGTTAAKGFRFAIDDEILEFRRYSGVLEPFPLPARTDKWLVYRGVNDTIPASHSSGATLYAVRDAWAKSEDLTPPGPFDGGGTSLDADIVAALEAADSPSAGNPFATGWRVVTVPLSSVQILGLTSSVQVVAGVTGEVPVPIAAWLHLHAGVTPYTPNGSNMILSIGDQGIYMLQASTSVFGSATDDFIYFGNRLSDTGGGDGFGAESSIGQGLYLFVESDPPTDGNGTADVTVAYVVHTP